MLRDGKNAHSKPPLLLIPGTMSTAIAWRFQIEALGVSRPVVIPEDHYSLHSIRDMAEQIGSAAPPYFDMVGWSMGGYIALELYPLVCERVRKIVLLCTSARSESEERYRSREELLRCVRAEGLRTAYRRVISDRLVNSNRVAQGYQDEILDEVVQLGERTLQNQIRAMQSRVDARRSLKQMQCEALVIGGRHDTVTPIECSEEMRDLLPNATLHVVEDAGHFAPWENAAEINDLIEHFLDL